MSAGCPARCGLSLTRFPFLGARGGHAVILPAPLPLPSRPPSTGLLGLPGSMVDGCHPRAGRAPAGGTGLGELHRAAQSRSAVLVVPWQVEGAGGVRTGGGGSNGRDHDGRTTGNQFGRF